MSSEVPADPHNEQPRLTQFSFEQLLDLQHPDQDLLQRQYQLDGKLDFQIQGQDVCFQTRADDEGEINKFEFLVRTKGTEHAVIELVKTEESSLGRPAWDIRHRRTTPTLQRQGIATALLQQAFRFIRIMHSRIPETPTEAFLNASQVSVIELAIKNRFVFVSDKDKKTYVDFLTQRAHALGTADREFIEAGSLPSFQLALIQTVWSDSEDPYILRKDALKAAEKTAAQQGSRIVTWPRSEGADEQSAPIPFSRYPRLPVSLNNFNQPYLFRPSLYRSVFELID